MDKPISAKDMTPPAGGPAATKPAPPGGTVTMVEAPTLRVPTPPVETAVKDNTPKNDTPPPAGLQ